MIQGMSGSSSLQEWWQLDLWKSHASPLGGSGFHHDTSTVSAGNQSTGPDCVWCQLPADPCRLPQPDMVEEQYVGRLYQGWDRGKKLNYIKTKVLTLGAVGMCTLVMCKFMGVYTRVHKNTHAVHICSDQLIENSEHTICKIKPVSHWTHWYHFWPPCCMYNAVAKNVGTDRWTDQVV